MNNENLKKGNPDTQFRSGREAVENGRKGGKASGVSRGFKSTLKRKFRENPELYEEFADMLTNEALNEKNLKAAEMLIDLMGESAQRESLSLRKEELKLKEKAAENVPEDTSLCITIGYGDETENENESAG